VFWKSKGSLSRCYSQQVSSSPNPDAGSEDAARLKKDILTVALASKRGFASSKDDKIKINELIEKLAPLSPTKMPASAYFATDDQASGGAQNTASASATSSVTAKPGTLTGKWTLKYTDAPDITSLEGGFFAPAKLGRIGQECNPPIIKNVIEWTKPEWASSLPLSGSNKSRIIQKVCLEGNAKSSAPNVVELKVTGLDLLGFHDDDNDNGGDDAMEGSSKEMGGGNSMGILSFLPGGGKGPAAFFQANPVELRGPLTAPFGRFEILYLDDEMRIIRTYQNYIAINVREEEWF